MKVSPVSYNLNSTFRSDKAKAQTARQKVYTPAGIGAVAAVGCFGIGFLFDRTFALLFNLTRSIKTSFVLNSLVGLAVGAYTYKQAKNLAEK